MSAPPPRKAASDRRAEIIEALKAAGGNVTRAAETLGITRQTLYKQARMLGLEREFGLAEETADPRPTSPAPGTEDLKRAITIKIPESLWLWVRITALQRRTTSGALVEEALEQLRAVVEGGK